MINVSIVGEQLGWQCFLGVRAVFGGQHYLKKLTSIHKPVVMLDHKENLYPNIDHVMHHEVDLKAEIYIIQAHPNYPGLSCGEP